MAPVSVDAHRSGTLENDQHSAWRHVAAEACGHLYHILKLAPSSRGLQKIRAVTDSLVSHNAEKTSKMVLPSGR